MRSEIIRLINTFLANRLNYFIREQDIQLYLAREFLNTGIFDNVFIEYHIPRNLIPNYLWSDNNIYIDIVLESNNIFYPIEIKYKTVSQELPFFVFGQITNVTLGHHGAQNIGCYDFWKDIKRIELFENTFQNVQRGIVLFISNDLSYQNPPLNPNAGFAPFSIDNNRFVPQNVYLNWNRNLAIANGRPGFSLDYSYSINWVQLNIPQHYYILV